jgi:hypothetical protein
MTIAIAALAISSPYIIRADEKGQVGRYQLVYAVTETSTIQFRSVWKIDTVTGQVWQFVSSHLGGEVKERFVRVETSEP